MSKVLGNISIAKLLYSRKTRPLPSRGSYSKEDIVRAVDLVKRIKHPSEVLVRIRLMWGINKLCRDIVNDYNRRLYALEENSETQY